MDDAQPANNTPRAMVSLSTGQDKTLLRPAGSRRHAVFTVRASMAAVERGATPEPRRPLSIALTLDRSGSMSGAPLQMAKQVAAALVESLDERDEVAVVIFDDRIDTLQELAPVTPDVKAQIRQRLTRVEARGSTALHEAWLTACNLLASDHLGETRLARCYLLTDGLANVGETDVETIATQAAGVREQAGVGTSAFGLGPQYNEHLLGPWSVAGGGQFHHLETLAHLADTFMGERDELRAVVALRTRLELELTEGMSAEVISAYWGSGVESTRMMLDIGDLLSGEERRVVVRFGFPSRDLAFKYTARARVHWTDYRGEQVGDWHEVTFTYGAPADVSAEQRDPEAMRWIGRAHADQTMRRALELNKAGRVDDALSLIQHCVARIREYANGDETLLAAMDELRELENRLQFHTLDPMTAKERYFRSQTSSRSQRDHRTH